MRAVAPALLLLALPGCNLLLGDLDVSVAAVDASTPDVAPPSDAGGASEAAAPSDARVPPPDGSGCTDERACAGKCGTVTSACGDVVDCGGCPAGLTCGGGGPNVCGTGTCTPSCAGKACGASDGCQGICASGACGTGLHCAAGKCVCDATSCSGCCAAGQCLAGTAPGACGKGGAACAVCSAPSGATATCSAGACGFSCDAQHLACGSACCAVYGNPTPFSGTGGYTSDELCVRPVTIGQSGRLASVGIITSTSGAGVRLGLYADSAGAPGALVAQTGAGTLNGSAVVLSTPLTSVSAGNYWIALLFDAAVDVLEDRSTTVTSYCTTATFGSLPSSFPSVASYQGGPANLYVLVQ